MLLTTLIDAASKSAGSQNALARKLGVSSGRVSDWRKGRQHCPDEKIARMAEIAGLPVEETWHAVAWHRLGKVFRASLAGAVAIIATFGAYGDARAAEAATKPNV